MSDSISRQAAIDAIESHIRTAQEPYVLQRADEIMNYAFEVSASCIYNLPSAEPRWIPCSERLPEPYTQDILVTVDNGARYIDVLNYDTPGDGTYDVKWHKTDSDGYPIIYDDVVAWMDMKPWKGETDG